MLKHILKFGLLAGAIMSVVMAATIPFMERIPDGIAMAIGYTSMLLAFLMVYFGVRSWREKAGGYISFWQGFRIGICIATIGCCCYVATWEVIYYNVMPDFAEKYGAHQLEQAKAAGAPQAVIEAKRKEMEEFARTYRNPLANVAMTLLEPLPPALLVTLIAAGLLRRRPPQAAPA